MKLFWQMVRVELTKILKGRLFWVSLGVFALIITAAFIGMFASRNALALTPEDQAEMTASVVWPEAIAGALVMVFQVGGLVLVALAGVMVAQEYSWRTAALWLSMGTPRSTILVAKALSLLIVLLVFTITPLLIIGPLSAYFTVAIKGSLDMGLVNWAQVALGVLRTAWIMVPYMALAFFMAIVTRSSIGAIAAGVGFALLVEPLLMEMMKALGAGALVRFMPDMLGTSIFSLNSGISPTGALNMDLGGVSILPPETATLLVAAYALVLFAMALWVFRRQDITQ